MKAAPERGPSFFLEKAMALSYVQFTGDGSTTTFSVPFQYLSRTHVGVTVDGSARSFSWISTNQISVSPPPANGSVVEVRRTTPRDKLLVDFVDGSVLTEGDLDTSALQSFFLAQEAFDLQGGSLGLAPDGSFSAYNRRITNVGAPVNGSDAINKDYHDGTFLPQMNSLLSQTTQAKNDAVAAKGQSESARDAANQSKVAAAVSEAYAETSEFNAKTSETNAASSASGAGSARDRAILAETNANNSAQTATDKAGQAQASADTALTQAGIAQSHKDAAAQSATNASNSATAADTSKTKAMKWAEEAEDVAVETGMFSAKHWARKAMAYVGSLHMPAIVAGAYMRGKADLSAWETVTPNQVREDIGAAAASHSHSEYLPLSGGQLTGQLTVRSGSNGYTTVNSSNGPGPGFLEFVYGNGSRVGYVGSQPSSSMLGLVAEQGWQWRMTGNVNMDNALATGGGIVASGDIRSRSSQMFVDNAGWGPAHLWLRTADGANDRGLLYYATDDRLRLQLRNGSGGVKTQITLNPDGNINVGPGQTISTDGNIWMSWANNWLSDVLNGKVQNAEDCSHVGINNGNRPYFRRQAGGGSLFVPRNASANDIAFDWNGNLQFNIDSATGWRMILDSVNHSDLRIKTDVKEMKAGLDVIKSLHPVTFRYDPEKAPIGLAPYNLGVRYGFIAQEVLKVFPDAVQEIDIPFDANGETEKVVNGKKLKFKKEDWEDKLKVVQQEQFIAVLVKAVQELASRVEKLEAKK